LRIECARRGKKILRYFCGLERGLFTLLEIALLVTVDGLTCELLTGVGINDVSVVEFDEYCAVAVSDVDADVDADVDVDVDVD
jgi:hypothetical protein